MQQKQQNGWDLITKTVLQTRYYSVALWSKLVLKSWNIIHFHISLDLKKYFCLLVKKWWLTQIQQTHKSLFGSIHINHLMTTLFLKSFRNRSITQTGPGNLYVLYVCIALALVWSIRFRYMHCCVQLLLYRWSTWRTTVLEEPLYGLLTWMTFLEKHADRAGTPSSATCVLFWIQVNHTNKQTKKNTAPVVMISNLPYSTTNSSQENIVFCFTNILFDGQIPLPHSQLSIHQ